MPRKKAGVWPLEAFSPYQKGCFFFGTVPKYQIDLFERKTRTPPKTTDLGRGQKPPEIPQGSPATKKSRNGHHKEKSGDGHGRHNIPMVPANREYAELKSEQEGTL